MASAHEVPLRYGPDLQPTAQPMLVLAVVGVHALVGWGLLQARATTASSARVVPVLLSLDAPLTPARHPSTPAVPNPPGKGAPAQEPRPTPAAAVPPKPPLPSIAADLAPAAATGVALGPTSAPAAAATPVAESALEPPPPSARRSGPTQSQTPRGVARTELHCVVQPSPAYPSTSRRLGETGEVHLRVEIDTDGLPRQVSVHRSSGFPRLDESAVAAMRAARFAPFIEHGVALVVWTIVPIEFQLQG